MNLLNLKIGTSIRKLIVKNITEETIYKEQNGEEKAMVKVVFLVEDPCTGNRFNISDAWVENENQYQIKGLWLALQNDGNEILKTSTLAKVMEYYKTDTLGTLIDTTIDAYPDNRNFLVLVACNLPENI